MRLGEVLDAKASILRFVEQRPNWFDAPFFGDGDPALARSYAESFLGVVRVGTPYAVQSEMHDILELAALGVPSYRWSPRDLFTPYGFLLLPRDFTGPTTTDDDGPVSPRALAWGCWQESGRARSDLTPDNALGFSLLTFAYVDSDLVPCAIWSWDFGQAWDDNSIADGVEDHSVTEDPSGEMRAFAALMKLLPQRIARVADAGIDRASRRRAMRAGVDNPSTGKIVTLRYAREHQVDAVGLVGNVDWSHRWPVEGHWRDQWYPSIGTHSPIYVSPYIKGPPDKPLVLRQRMFDWKR